jgi:meso-butanediol dehydrogenase/(S,S)-butanediol dehydrogenase/diacetyl reductase
MRRFEDKVVLVTGAASGIGRACALRLAEEGAAVFCTDVLQEAVQETAEQAAKLGGQAEARLCDVSRPEDVRATVAACVDRFGKLDSLCNVAGVLRMDNFHELALEDWNRVLAVNLTGPMLMCQAALPHLLATSGNIVNVCSTSALAGLPWGAAYSASKGGLLAFTRTLAIEYGRKGLRVNAVCPGSVTTPMAETARLPEGFDRSLIQRVMPLDKARGPETVAGVIAMLASEDAAHINGESIRVDGGTLS